MSDGLSCYGSGGGGRVRRLFRYVPGQAGYTFTNASANGVPTYVDSSGIIHSVNTNTLRDAHYIGGVRTTLLEGARTNSRTQSQAFTNIVWHNGSDVGGVTTDNVAVSPDGTSNAALIREDTSTGTHIPCSGVVTTTAATWTFSVFFKNSSGSRQLALYHGTSNTGAQFSTTGAITAGAFTLPPSYGVQTLGNGWFRGWISVTATAASNEFRLWLVSGTNTLSYTGDGTSGYNVYGGMIELGAFPSSYIATVGSTVTRAADVLTFPYTPIPQAMTTYCDCYELEGIHDGTQRWTYLLCKSDGSAAYLGSSFASGSDTYTTQRDFGGGAVNTTGITAGTFGQEAEIRSLLRGTGAIATGVSINAGAETVSADTATATLAANWSQPTLINLGQFNAGASGNRFFAVKSLKIAAGVQSLSVMRSL